MTADLYVEENADYPLISKDKNFKKFRRNLLEFLSRLLQAAKDSIAFDGSFLPCITNWAMVMSGLSLRSFRHTATIIALAVVTNLCTICGSLHDHLNTLNRQSKKISKGKKEAQSSKKASELQSRISKLEAVMQELFVGYVYIRSLMFPRVDCLTAKFGSVFVHRYRDVAPQIRAECVTSLGEWIEKNPSYFLDDNYFKYLGWLLSDKVSASVWRHMFLLNSRLIGGHGSASCGAESSTNIC